MKELSELFVKQFDLFEKANEQLKLHSRALNNGSLEESNEHLKKANKCMNEIKEIEKELKENLEPNDV